MALTIQQAKAELAAMVEADGGRAFVAAAIDNGASAGTLSVSAEDVAAADAYMRSTHATRMRQEQLETAVWRAEQASAEHAYRAQGRRNGVGR